MTWSPHQSRWPKATFDRRGLSVCPAHTRDAYWVLSQLPLCSPYRTVIQELTKGRRESRSSPDVKLYLFAGTGKKPLLHARGAEQISAKARMAYRAVADDIDERGFAGPQCTFEGRAKIIRPLDVLTVTIHELEHPVVALVR